MELSVCRWRSSEVSPGRYGCHSPKLVVAPGGVGVEDCVPCYCRDHEPAAGATCPAGPCRHLGEPTGEQVECPSCAGAVRVKLFGCAVYGTCSLGKPLPGHGCCTGCPDREPTPKAAAGPSAHPEHRGELFLTFHTGTETGNGLGDYVHTAHLLQLYRRRGWTVRVHVRVQDHEFLGRGAGFVVGAPDGLHPLALIPGWEYPPDFNRPDPASPGSGSVIAHNLRRPRLPALQGEPAALWEEACAVSLEGAASGLVGRDARARVAAFLRDLARPVVLLHTRGDAYGDRKDLPGATRQEVCRLLTAAGCGVVLLDREVGDGPPARHWARGTLEELTALYDAADLLVGVDSAPLHWASLTRLPALGLFTGFHPSCVSLPRARVTNLARSSWGEINAARAAWNVVEYPGDSPESGTIAREALALLGRRGSAGLYLTAPEWAAHSLLDGARRAALARLAADCCRLPGDLAELGVYRGGSAGILASGCPAKTLHLWDTFAGLPADDVAGGHHRAGEFAAELGAVRALLAGRRVEYHAGYFPGTAARLGHLRFALVHLDADLYESTRDALAWFWPRLVPGGGLVLDDVDWPATPGVSRALREAGLYESLERTAPHQAVLRKPLP